MDVMNFKHEHDDDGGAFYLVDNGDQIGEITYQYDNIAGDRYVVDWVEVDPEFRGQGLARRLVDRMANFARQRGYMIRPTCGVVRSIMEGDPAYGDVLEAGGEGRPRA